MGLNLDGGLAGQEHKMMRSSSRQVTEGLAGHAKEVSLYTLSEVEPLLVLIKRMM